MMKYRVSILVLSLLLSGCAAFKASQPPEGSKSAITTLSKTPIVFFRKYISAADGDRCSMTPSCSQYAAEAIDRHGVAIGWIMAFDRIMRCGRDELKHHPPVMMDGQAYCPDSVADNDFWWNPSQ